MKIVHTGLFLLLATCLAEMSYGDAYYPGKKITGTHSRTRLAVQPTARTAVITLPASSLPAGAIVPPLNTTSRPPTATRSTLTTALNTPTDTESAPFPVASNANRWQFYSYP